MADGALHPGSGGIDVNNAGFGPDNRIDNVVIKSINSDGGGAHYPSFGIRLQNEGAATVNGVDVTGMMSCIIASPATGQSVQAVKFGANNYCDAARANNIVLQPIGGGYIFDFHLTDMWVTNIGPTNTSGLILDDSRTVPAQLPTNIAGSIVGVKYMGGSLLSVTGQTGSGVQCAAPSAIDVTISGASIAGWNAGIDLAPGCSHWNISNNNSGAFGPFAFPPSVKTNQIGIRTQGGTSDYLDIHDNNLFGNTVAALADSGSSPGSGTHSVFHHNMNAGQSISSTAVGASPAAICATSHRDETHSIKQSASFNAAVTLTNAASGGAGSGPAFGMVTSAAAPLTVPLSANECMVVTWSGTEPNDVKTIH